MDRSHRIGLGFHPVIWLILGAWCLTAALPAQVLAADGPPVILVQPQSRTVVPGTNCTFSVSADGTAPLCYQWRFNGTDLAGQTNATLLLANIQPANAGAYQAVVTNVAGAVTSAVATLTVRDSSDPVYVAPAGGWAYRYTGDGVASAGGAALDGTWNHDNGSDAWGGDGRGLSNGPVGGLSSTNGILTLEDDAVTGTTSTDNRRLYFTHVLAQDPVTNANTILNDGVTLSFRARLTPPSDPLIELTNVPNGFVNVSDGKGMLGLRQSGNSGMIVSFSLNLPVEDTSPTTTYNFGQAGLHMNNLNGDVRSSNVDPGEGGTLNLLPLDPGVFHEFWITIQDNGAAPGTHRVSIYVDGGKTPTIFNVTAGLGADTPLTNYLAIGLPNTTQVGAFDLDFLAYQQGVLIPLRWDEPVAFVAQPVSRALNEGQAAGFSVSVTGTPPFSFQWYKNGLPINGATNGSYTTPPATPADDGAQFTVLVGNAVSTVTSSPAVLTVTSDRTPPTLVSAGSLNGSTIGLCFSEAITPASAQNPANYAINGGAISVTSATLRPSDGASVLLTVSGLTNRANTPFTVTASGIQDISLAGNLGGGTAAGIVQGLAAADIGTAGIDPLAAGSTFTCSSNGFEVVAGGSDIGGSADGFHSAFMPRSGDFDVMVRVARLDPSDRAARAGLVAREDLSAGSRNISVTVTPANVPAADGSGNGLNIYEATYRPTAIGSTAAWPGGNTKAGVPYPNAWVRLIRLGATFTAYHGTNGVDWYPFAQLNESLPSTLYVGLAATAHTNAADRTTTAAFQDFLFAPAPVILAQPQSLVVTNGDAASFSVTASGLGTLRYQWRLNGNVLAGETNALLLLPHAGPSQAGTYDVIVANGGGATLSEPATLIVRTLDYGDAPPPYPTRLADNGARHLIVPGIFLGAGVDYELDGQPNATATGDDLAGGDEDGVRFTTLLVAGEVAAVEVVASTNGFLDAWMDFNANGSWADESEQVFARQPLAAGTNVLPFLVLPSAAVTNSFARFRFSSAGGLEFTGPAPDGEVEDHAITVTPVADLALTGEAAPDPVAVSSNLTLRFTVANGGPSTATGVMLTNQLPASVSVIAINPSQGSCTPAGNTIVCSLGSVSSGAGATVTVVVAPTAAGTLTTVATVSANELDLTLADNTAGTTTTVELAPVITAPPVSLIVTQGNNPTFSVAATGTEPLNYQWFFNSTALEGQTSPTLAINNAQPAQAGAYTVRISNRVGAVVSAPATLTVLVPPAITQEPQSRTNFAGSIATFSVAATGTAPLRYQWYFNATNALPDGTNAVLELANVQKSQSGDYTVVVANDAGVVTSLAAALTVIEMDFGDAPEPPYPTTLAGDGARHRIVPGFCLGRQVDFEPDAQPQAAANGDDSHGSSDEDGVLFLTPLRVGQPATIEVVASSNGVLNAWLDFNANGSWAEAGEHIFIDQPLAPGTNSLSLTVPSGAATTNTFARFRFSSAAGLSFVGEAPDGEVEDYQVALNAAVDLGVSMAAAPDPVAVGSNLVFTLTVTNAGPSPATTVTLSDLLPANAGFASAASSQGSCTNDGGSLTCYLGSLSAGTAASITVVVVPAQDGVLTNRAGVTGLEHEVNAADNTAVATVVAVAYPVITAQPQSLTVTNGASARFSVGATGTALQYQWQLNGADLPGQTDAVLLIENAQPGHAGSYTVRLGNQLATVLSQPATLTVLVPAQITTQPQSQTVVAGADVTFHIVALGTEPLSYQWSFGGTDLAGETGPSLLLSGVQPAQAGMYRVRVSNSAGVALSDPADLTVLVPPAIAGQPQSQTTFAGRDVTLSVTATGTAPLSYQWYLDATNLIAAGTNAVLTLTNAQKAQSGDYAVVVTNHAAAVTSLVARVTIQEADFGDAPADGYATRLVFNGAYHLVVPGVHLGASIDFEPDGQPDPNATGDDLNGLNDDDGVTFTGPLLVGQLAGVTVVASTNGYLDAWVDFDRNGFWAELGEPIFTRQPLAAGANALNFRVPSTAATGLTFARFRFSTVGGLPYDGPAPDGEVEDYQVSIAPAVDLAVGLVDQPDPVPLGSNLLYTITVTNHGPSRATSVSVRDQLPPNVSFVAASPSQGGCTNQAGVVACGLGQLTAGATARITVQVAPRRPGMITNSVTVTAAESEVNPADNAASQTTAVTVGPASFVNATSFLLPPVGPASIYPSTILVSGLTATVYKVTVTLSSLNHTFPDDLDILLVGPDGQSVVLMSDAGGAYALESVTVTFDDDSPLTLPDSARIVEETFPPTNYEGTQDAFPPPAPAGPYGAALSVFKGTDPNGAWSLFIVDDSDQDSGELAGGWSLSITGFDPMADLAAGLVAAPNPVTPGSNLTYTVTVTNRGPVAATGVILSDPLPNTLSLVSAVPSQGSCTNAGGLIRCELGTLAKGSNATVRLVTIPLQLGTVTNSVSVSSSEVDPRLSNNMATSVITVKDQTDLAISQVDVPDPALLGQELVYTLVITNLGQKAASGVLVVDTLPRGFNLLTATPSQGSCAPQAGTVSCDLGTLAAGAGARITLTGVPTLIGMLTNTASVTSDLIEFQTANNVTAEVTTAAASFGPFADPAPITVTAAGPAGLYPSTIFVSGLPAAVYRVTVSLHNLTHPLPEGLDVLLVGPSGQSVWLMGSAGGDHSVNDLMLTFDDAAAPLPDADAIVSGTFRPTAYGPAQETMPAPAPPPPYGAALGVFTGTDPNGPWSLYVRDEQNGNTGSIAGGWSLAITVLESIADLRIAQTPAPDPAAVGSNVTFTIRMTNLGPSTASGVVLVDALPAGMNLVAAAASQGSCTNNQGTITCALGSLDNGAQAWVTITAAATRTGMFTNLASVQGLERDPYPGNNTVSATITIEDPPVITLQPSSQTVIEGNTATFDVAAGGTEPLRFQWQHNGADLLDATNRDLTVSFATAEAAGDYQVVVRNRVGIVVSQPVHLTVRMLPTISSIADQVIDEDTPSGPLAFTVGDVETAAANLNVTVSCPDLVLVPPANLVLGGSGANRTLSLVPGTNQSGTATITLTVTDEDGATASTSFTLTVRPVNDPPSLFGITDLAMDEDTVLTINFTVADVESPAEALGVSVECSDTVLVPPANLVLGGNGSARSLTVRPATNQYGAAFITLVVSDPDGGVVSNRFGLTVSPVNDLPTLDGIGNVVLEEDSGPSVVNVSGIGSGAANEAQPLSVVARSSDPAIVPDPLVTYTSPEGTASLVLTPATNATGVVTITVTVNDGQSANSSTSRSFTVRVNPVNDPPVLGPVAEQVTAEDTPLMVAFGVEDVDSGAGALVVSATSADTNLVQSLVLGGSGTNRTLSLSPAPDRWGATTITLVVTDLEGASTRQSFGLRVEPVNDRPTLDPLGDLVLAEDAGPQTIALSGIGSGAANEQETLAVSTSSSNTNLTGELTVSYVSPASAGTLSFLPATNVNGTATITVTVNDGGLSNNLISRSFTVRINPVNDLPTISAIADQTIEEDTPSGPIAFTVGDVETAAANLRVTASSSDPLLVPPTNLVLGGSGANRTLDLLPATNQSGTATITLTVTDEDGASASTRFGLTVNPVNDPPSLSGIPDQVMDEDTVRTINFTIADVESPANWLAVWAATSDPVLLPPANLVLGGSGAERTLTVRPATNQYGAAQITLVVADPDGGVVSNRFGLTVSPVNDPPTLDGIGNVVLNEDSGPYVVALSGIGSGAANEDQALSVVARSSDPAIVPDPLVTYTSPEGTASLVLTPAINATGVVTITVTVNDGQSANSSTSRSFTVRVNPVNDPPVLGPVAEQVTAEDTPLVVAFTVTDVESGAGALVVSAQSADTNLVGSLVLGGSGINRTLSLSPAPDQWGATTISLEVRDPEGASTRQSFGLRVEPVNDRPTLDPLGDLVLAEDAGPQTIALSGIGSGAANELQVLTVTATSSDPALIAAPSVQYHSADPNGTLSFLPGTNAGGTATITVTVNDGGLSNNIISRSFTVTVNPVNDPPVISPIANSATDEDTATVVPFTVSDAETPADNLTVTGTSANPSLVPDAGLGFGGSGTNRTVTITPAANQFGAAAITLTVTDAGGATASTSFVVTVDPINDPPVISDIPDQTIVEDTATAAIPFTISDAETPADGLAVAAYSSDPMLAPPANIVFGGSGSNRTVTVTPAPNASGSATITVTVRDAEGLTASDTFVLRVTATNDPPFISAIPDQVVNESTTIGLPFAVGDAETPAGNLAVTVQSGNPVLVPTNNLVLGGSGANRTIAVTPAVNQSGTAPITLTVTDTDGGSASVSFVLTVNSSAQAPLILTQPQSQTVTNGDTVTLLVTATGSAPLSYQWQFNGGALAGATNASLTLANVQSGNAGTYAVVVTNRVGSATSSPATLAVLNRSDSSPPVISAIANQTTDEDTPITVAFQVQDADSPVYLLSLSGSSTNTALVAATNLFFNGAGTNRTVIIVPSPDQFGTTWITLTAGDGSLQGSNSFALVVNPVNDPPTLGPLSNLTFTAGSANTTVPLTGISSGAANENQTLTVSAVSSAPSLIGITGITYTSPNSTGSLALKVFNKSAGMATVTVTVDDGQPGNNIVTRAFNVYVRPSGNTPPTISGITNRAINEDTSTGPISFTVGDSATPANLLTVTGSSSNPALVPSNAITFGGSGGNRTVTITPAVNQSGAATITLSVTDTNLGYAETSFVLTVNPVNDLPVISAIPSQVVDEDTPTAFIAFTVGDVETPPGALVVAGSSANTALVPNANLVFGGAGSNRVLVVTPAANQSGAATIMVRVTDGNGGASSNSFVLTVNPVNDPPTLTDIADQAIDQNSATASLAFTVADTETAATNLTLTGFSSNPALVPTNAIVFGGGGGNRTVTVQPALGQAGTATLTITVTDANGGSASDSFLLTVLRLSTNTPPTLDPIGDVVLNQGTGLYTIPLAGISAGAGDVNQVVAVSAASSNPGLIPTPAVTYANPNASGFLNFTPAPGTNGAATITVTVNDGQSQDNLFSRSFTVTVRAFPAISLIAGLTIDEDTSTGPIAFTVADAETAASNLVVTAASSNPALIPNGNIILGGSGANRTVVLTPATHQSGSATITLTVTDGDGLPASTSFGLTVRPVNHPPTLDALPDVVIPEDAALQTISLTGISAGAPGEVQPLQITAASSNPALVPNPRVNYVSPDSAGTLSFAPLTNVNGSATITVTVNDGQSRNNTFSRSFTVTVSPVNDPPTLDPLPDLAVDENSGPHQVTLTGIGSGDPGETQPLTVSAISSDPAVILNPTVAYTSPNATGTLTFAPLTNAQGRAVITVTVNDGQSARNILTQAFAVTVLPVLGPLTLSDIPDQVTDEDQGIGPIAFTVGDSEAAGSNVTLSAASSNPVLVPEGNITFGGSGTQRTVVVRPATNQFGATTITITAKDPVNLRSASESFALSVNPINDPPLLSSIPNQVINENQTLTVAFVVSDPDSPASNLVVSALSSNLALVPASGLVLGGTGANRTLAITPAANRSGTNLITLTVTDPAGASASTSFGLVVRPVNDYPYISSIPDQVTDEDTPITVNFTIGDAETPASALVLGFTSYNPAVVPASWASFGGSGSNRTLRLVPAPNAWGSARIEIRVRDGDWNTDWRRSTNLFTLVVRPVNDPPTSSAIPDQVMAEDGEAVVAFYISDPESPASNLVVRASAADGSLVAPGGLVLEGTGELRYLRVRPQPDRFGSTRISLVVQDEAGASVQTGFGLTVSPVNDLPSLSAIPDQETQMGEAVGPVGLEVGDKESGPEPLVLGASASNAGLVPLGAVEFGGSGAQRSLVVRPAPGQYGWAVVTVSVADPEGGTTQQSFELVVHQTNGPPVIALEPQGQMLTNGGVLRLRVVATGPGPLSYRWQREGVDLAGQTNATLVLSPVSMAESGAYQVVVANGAGSVTSAVAAVRVYEPVRIVSISREGAGVTRLAFTTVVGQIHTVEYAETLGGSWTALGQVTGTGQVMSVRDETASGPARFYRVRME